MSQQTLNFIAQFCREYIGGNAFSYLTVSTDCAKLSLCDNKREAFLQCVSFEAHFICFKEEIKMQKKFWKRLLLVAVMAVLCVAVGVTASAETWGDYEYKVLDDGTVEITNYYGDETKLEIPNEIEGKRVSSLREYSFSYNNKIETVIIPANVEFIKEFAFGSCYNLEKFEVDTNSGFFSADESGVLFNKDKTKLIQYPNGKKDVEYKVPDSVETLGVYSLTGLLDLQKLTLNANIKNIEYGAVGLNPALTEICIPESAQSVGYGAFIYSMFIENICIRSMNAVYDELALSIGNVKIAVSQEEFIEIGERYVAAKDKETENEIANEINSTLIYTEDLLYPTIYCHAGSTAEAYAIEYGAPYVLTHFFEDEWFYDEENKYCYRKCIHCDEREISEDIGDIEIEAPANPDTDFTVDVVEDYVIIEETISNNVTTDFEIVKAFDINLKNKDGVHVQPNGTVKVKLPNDWSKNGVYKVYRVNDDGTLTDMNAYRQGSHMVFETDHFSIYVIVNESEKTDEPVVPDEPQEEGKNGFFAKIIDLIKAFFELIASIFKK